MRTHTTIGTTLAAGAGALLALAGPPASTAPGALPPVPEGVERRLGVVYGKGGTRELKLTLFLPKDAAARKPMPGMVFLHGGGWSGGGPEQFYPQASALAAKGIVCASAAYRLSREAKYPAAVEDAKCAVRWMRAHAKELNVDPERIGCAGGSAGGHLAAMLATTPGMAKLEGTGGWEGISSRVCLAVLFNPVLDLRGLGDAGQGLPMLEGFLGAGPKERPDLYDEASPSAHAGKETAPCLIFHGTADTTVPFQQSVRFRDTLKEAGVPVELVPAEGEKHGFFNRGDWYDKTYAKMEAWLTERFAK